MTQSEIGSMTEVAIRERFAKHLRVLSGVDALRAVVEDVIALSPAERAVALDSMRAAAEMLGQESHSQRLAELMIRHAEVFLPFQQFFAGLSTLGAEVLEDHTVPFMRPATEAHRAITPEEIAARRTSLHDELITMAKLVADGHVAGCLLVAVSELDDSGADRCFVAGPTLEAREAVLEALHSQAHEVLIEAHDHVHGRGPAAPEGAPS